MKMVTAVREGVEDVYADAKAINEYRAEAEAAAVVEDASAEESKASEPRNARSYMICRGGCGYTCAAGG